MYIVFYICKIEKLLIYIMADVIKIKVYKAGQQKPGS